MSQLKSLASQTAIYGVSSILGRLINYALVPLHTAVFLPTEMGVVTALYAYTAIFMIIYTFGMETAYFRFAKDNPTKAYRSCASVIVLISSITSVFLILFSNEIAHLIGYSDTGLYIKWIAIIMWIDAIVSIPFAKLRFENSAKKFASVKVISIVLNILIQSLLLLIIPFLMDEVDSKTNIPESTIGYIFLANLIANSSIIVFLFKEIKEIRIVLNFKDLKPYLLYAFPIFLMGLGGMLNEQLDKILMEHLLPNDFYSTMDSTAALGVYGQTFKLAIFMMLAIQAFRYAGEPFFFSQSEDKKAPELFAKVMHYFIICALLLFVLVSINVDLIAHVFLRKPEYRIALYLVPILLFGKLLYGVYINLSIWFKIKDKTIFGTYFSMAGLLITIVGNVLLIPSIGMIGAAATTVACYLTMCLLCYHYGQKYFPVPYNFVKLAPHLFISALVVCTAFLFKYPDLVIDSVIRVLISGVLVGMLWLYEKRNLKAFKV